MYIIWHAKNAPILQEILLLQLSFHLLKKKYSAKFE